jgi:transposase-like protein
MATNTSLHLVRHSLNFCAWKDHKEVAADLRRIYSASTADQAGLELDAFEEKRAGKYASIAPAWRRAWQEVIPFFAFDPAIRKIIYIEPLAPPVQVQWRGNAIESLNRIRRENSVPHCFLAIRSFEKGGRNVREWFAARNHFAIMFEDRFNA